MAELEGTAFEMEFSALAHNLFRSPIRAVMMPVMAAKASGVDVALLAGGFPHESLFPATELTLTLRDGGTTAPYPLTTVLQYHEGGGVAPLRERLHALNLRVHHTPHHPPGTSATWQTLATVGCAHQRCPPASSFFHARGSQCLNTTSRYRRAVQDVGDPH